MTTLLFDFSRVLLHPKDKTIPSLNGLYRSLLQQKQYNFFDHFELNEVLFTYLKTIKDTYPLFIFTSDTIQNAPEIQDELRSLFKGIYSAKDLGVSKKDPEAYRLLIQHLHTIPTDLLYIDDTLDNIVAAKSAGLRTIHFTKNELLIKELQKL